MSIDISDLPEYGDAMREFRLARGEAEAKGDELGMLQADHAWERKRNELMQRKYAALQHTAAMDTARTEALAQFPKVKPELYGHISDPAQVLAYAKQLQESIDEAAGTPAGAQSWGGQAPTSSAVSPPASPPAVTPRSDGKDQVARINELAPVVYTQGKKALAQNEEVRQLALSPIANRLIDNMSKAAGYNVETGEAAE